MNKLLSTIIFLCLSTSLYSQALRINEKPVNGSADDSIKLTFLGTGAPRPSLTRYGPSILVEAGNQRLLVDAGPGMRERLFEAGGFELLTDINLIILTHLHFDHTIWAQNPYDSVWP